MTQIPVITVGMAALIGLASAAHAQNGQGADVPAAAVEFAVGRAEFLDDSAIPHAVFGGAARWYVTPRIALGPELTYMVGPRQDRDLIVTGNLTFDLRAPATPASGRVEPYLVGGGGWFRHRNRFGTRTFVSDEGTVTGGGGVRVWLTRSVYAAADARIGWEPHVRVTAHVGIPLGRR